MLELRLFKKSDWQIKFKTITNVKVNLPRELLCLPVAPAQAWSILCDLMR